MRNRWTNHFENNRAMARINLARVRANSGRFEGYQEGAWGLTASDGPSALASFPYTPQASMAALRYYYERLGPLIWDVYGFRDAYNPSEGWVAPISMGLNQAPIVVMIEIRPRWRASRDDPQRTWMFPSTA